MCVSESERDSDCVGDLVDTTLINHLHALFLAALRVLLHFLPYAH